MANLSYNLLTTGDCQSTDSGQISLSVFGGTPGYSIQWIEPSVYGTEAFSVSPYTKGSLSGGSYSFRVTDATTPINNTSVVNFFVSTGVCVSIQTQDTTCNLSNGSITATTNTSFGTSTVSLYSNGNLITTSPAESSITVFDQLSAGTYYVTATDAGGCTGTSETCLVRNSSEFDFGLLVINGSSCTSGLGKLYVTGNTGTAPYTYQWSTNTPNANLSSPSVSGLSVGSYSVTVTDATGCQVTKSGNVGLVPSLELISYTTTPSTCLNDDGTVTFNITGGTPPYNYILSTGESVITYNTTYTFTNLPPNTHTVQIVDLALCNFTQTFQVPAEGNFNIIGVTTQNVTCSSFGSISINLIGNSPFTYVLTYPDGSYQTIISSTNSYTFNNLSAGTYNVTINDYLGSCEYSDDYIIETPSNFSITDVTSTDATCGLNNGVITVSVLPGTSTNFNYQLSNGVSSGLITDTEYTFTDLLPGQYNLTITDENNCQQQATASVSNQAQTDFNLYSTSCYGSEGGSISVIITEGTPPFIFTWNQSVGGQEGVYFTGLTPGEYVLLVTDSNNCSQQKSITVTCDTYNGGEGGSYQTFNICNSNFEYVANQKRGISQMFFEGYFDTANGQNCLFNSATFTTVLVVGSETYLDTFYTTYTLTNVPADSLWYQSIDSLLSQAYGVGTYNIDSSQNITIIKSDCNLPSNVLQDSLITIDLRIEYDLSCQS